MTLLVYKKGVLAADTGATRNDSREYHAKIQKIGIDKQGALFIAYGGNVADMTRHERMVRAMIRDGKMIADLVDHEWPNLNCVGIAVYVQHFGQNAVATAYEFNCFEDETKSGGVWCAVPDGFAVQGWDSAITTALAINHVQPDFDAVEIIRAASGINSAVDTRKGIHFMNMYHNDHINFAKGLAE